MREIKKVSNDNATTKEKKTNMQILADVEVLKCPIKAGYQKQGDTATVVVYGKPAMLPAPRVTLDELAKEFGSMVEQKEIGSNLPGEVGTMEFSLRQAYYGKQTKTEATGQAQKEEKPNDYALWLDIHSDTLTKGWPVKVGAVSIKIWNTASPQILKDMEITEMQTLLSYASSK